MLSILLYLLLLVSASLATPGDARGSTDSSHVGTITTPGSPQPPASSPHMPVTVVPFFSTPSPTNVTTPPFVTMNPASSVKYSIDLFDTGPAVLGSTITFTAIMTPQNVTVLPNQVWPVEFVYQWMNMADMTTNKTFGRLSSQFQKTFKSDGENLMTVAAFFKDHPTKVAAFQTLKFTITKKLNGHLLMVQNLEYRRFPNVFSTKKDMTFIANVKDNFQAPADKPQYSFIWFEEFPDSSRKLNFTRKPEWQTVIKRPSNFTLRTEVLAVFNDIFMDATDEVKSGSFKETVYFKDPLDHCSVLRVESPSSLMASSGVMYDDRSVELGQLAYINISCTGSGPVSVCQLITTQNASVPPPCDPLHFVTGTGLHTQIFLNTTGWSDIHFFVYNDISRTHLTTSLYAYDPEVTSVPSLVLPTVFVFLGLTILLLGTAYVMRLRKKPRVEVADFDFHPHLTSVTSSSHWLGQSDASRNFARLTNSLKVFFSKTRLRAQTYIQTPDESSSSEYFVSSQDGDGGSTLAESPLNVNSTEKKQFYQSL